MASRTRRKPAIIASKVEGTHGNRASRRSARIENGEPVLVEIEHEQAVFFHDFEPARRYEFTRPRTHPANVSDMGAGGIIDPDLACAGV